MYWFNTTINLKIFFIFLEILFFIIEYRQFMTFWRQYTICQHQNFAFFALQILNQNQRVQTETGNLNRAVMIEFHLPCLMHFFIVKYAINFNTIACIIIMPTSNSKLYFRTPISSINRVGDLGSIKRIYVYLNLKLS